MCATFENESTTFERRAPGLFTLRFSMVLKEQTPTQRDVVTDSLLLITVAGHTTPLGQTKEPPSALLNGCLCVCTRVLSGLEFVATQSKSSRDLLYDELVRQIRACSLFYDVFSVFCINLYYI